MNYIPLNVKTNYFLLSSMIDIKNLIQKCKEYKIKAIAITDPNMYGVLEFYKECKKNDIKPIIGLEIEYEKTKVYLYAMNYEGYQNLTRLISYKQNNKLDLNILKKYSLNLICIIPANMTAKFDQFKLIYQPIFISYSNAKEKEKLINHKDDLVFINECLFLEKEDDIYLKYLYMIRDGKNESDISDYQIKENSYLMTADEVDTYSNKSVISNFDKIFNLCNIDFSYNEKLLPKYKEEEPFSDYEYLKALCRKGLEKRLPDGIPNDYIKRLKYELDIINKTGFNNYFLVVWDFIKHAKKNNIMVGPGRGSSASSLVSYCLGITDVDPLKYNLLFERFLNPERISMPDIDIDFESNRRQEVVDYVVEKYGSKRAMPIITFVTLGGRQVIRDLGRIFNIDSKIIDNICKMININISLVENKKQNTKLYEIINKEETIKKIYEIGCKLEGAKRQFSVHAAGIVVSNYELDSYIPLQKYEGYFLTGFSMEHLEELGLLKIDFLGLKNLTLIENVLKKINKDNRTFNFNDIPLDDKNTLSLFEKGLTEGIFQFESKGMKNFIKKLKPNHFEEIIAAIALFRPGPMGNIDTYIKRKNGKEKPDYMHPNLLDILKPTYGIIVYQEQIMQIANVMAGYTLGEADVLRRAMSKKKKQVLVDEKEKFIAQSIKKGYLKEVAEKVYHLILKFADYGFPRAHSVAYSLIAYKMAFLKVHYPKYFMSSLLTNVIGNEVKTKEYINECKINTINVLKPDINLSCYHYNVEELGIRFSLAAIRNVGGIACKEIIRERGKGEYKDFFDFVERTYGRAVNRKTLETLINVGCFKIFGFNNGTLHYNIDNAINYAELVSRIKDDSIQKPMMETKEDFSKEQLAEKEYQSLGFYLTNHPTSKYKHFQSQMISSIELKSYFDKVINLILYVEQIKEIETKNNDKMAFMVGSDEYSSVDMVLFPKVYDTYKDIKKGDVLTVRGKVEKRMSRYQLIISKVEKL